MVISTRIILYREEESRSKNKANAKLHQQQKERATTVPYTSGHNG